MIISVEGNIGAGKSTILGILRDKYDIGNIVFLDEPLDSWLNLKDADDKNILEHFYEKPDRWSYSFQMHAFITRTKEILKSNNNNSIIIVERSVLTDRNVFAKLLYNEGKISELEWKLYNEWFLWLIPKMCNVTPDIYIYLRCSPETAFQRIQARGRVEENNITCEYIESVSKMHDDWLFNETDSVVTLDVENDITVDTEFRENLITTISAIIDMHNKLPDMEDMVNRVSCAC